jgi:hypothetical protein
MLKQFGSSCDACRACITHTSIVASELSVYKGHDSLDNALHMQDCSGILPGS